VLISANFNGAGFALPVAAGELRERPAVQCDFDQAKFLKVLRRQL
jgi:hypothetical protein